MSVKNQFHLLLAFMFGVAMLSSPVSAFDEQFYSGNNIEWYNPDAGGVTCQQSSSTTSNLGGTGTNKDYKGGTILSDAQLKAIGKNSPFYESAAKKAGIPWQLIAVIHLRETGLKRYNPDNRNGPYQILGTNYAPSTTISDDMFQKQTDEAAEFIKGKAGNKNALKAGNISEVKNTFFGYNGRASVYTKQAQSLGFNANQGYEGSPYVMNIADEPRDPAKARNGTWGQIKTDGGSLEYPANSDYGAFVVFSSIAGIATGGACDDVASGPTRQRVVALAEKELQLWLSGELKPGTDFHKYSQGRTEAWCADFVSWLYNKVGYPLTPSNEGNVPSVEQVKQIGLKGDKFSWHEAKGYIPKPGDLQIQQGNGISHVSLVVSVDGNKIIKIGGNQSGSSGPTTSSVTKDNWMPSTIGYVSPKG